MNISELIKRRRSTWDFQQKPVEKEKIMMCLEAARLAPSACNSQPWKFIIVDDPEVKGKLCEAAFTGAFSLNAFTRKAPVIVVIVSEQPKFMEKIGKLLRSTAYHLIDIGIAGEHFVLQAEELGLGTCWLGWFNEKAVKSILKIPRDRKVDIVIALGYPSREKLSGSHKRDSMEQIASFNSY
jgi:nitroreductase